MPRRKPLSFFAISNAAFLILTVEIITRHENGEPRGIIVAHDFGAIYTKRASHLLNSLEPVSTNDTRDRQGQASGQRAARSIRFAPVLPVTPPGDQPPLSPVQGGLVVETVQTKGD